MRKVTFGVGCSLDNYIARADGGVDWLMWGKEAAAIMEDYWKTIDTILMGRKTYDVALGHGGGRNPYKGMNTYVFSRIRSELQGEGAELVRVDPGSFLRDLKHGVG